jgi:hypothetical protein
VNWRYPKGIKGSEVLPRAITRMLIKTIIGIDAVEPSHLAIARCLGQN